VSFAYPGTSRVVLDDVSVTLPAGAVVAIVGENGAAIAIHICRTSPVGPNAARYSTAF
jgi:ABC-type hemin transport system ATPase subunit